MGRKKLSDDGKMKRTAKQEKPKKEKDSSLTAYKKKKVKWLCDFLITVDVSFFDGCMNEFQVDAVAKRIIGKKLEQTCRIGGLK